MAYPKNYNRKMLINLGTSASPDWKLIAVGILSRGNSISETTNDYYYMADRGTADTETSSQVISVSFTGHRSVGDNVQDYILDEVLYDLDKRDVEFMDYDETVVIPESGTKPVNGVKGLASISISDFGSGNTPDRQTIGFALRYKGKPTRGTVVATTTEGDTTYAFTAAT